MEAPRNIALVVVIITIIPDYKSLAHDTLLSRAFFVDTSAPLHHQITMPPSSSSSSSSCGNIYNISYPFALQDGTAFHYSWLSCDDKLKMLNLHTGGGDYVVLAINYDNYTIRVVDSDIYNNKDNCSSIPSFFGRSSYTYAPDVTVLETTIRYGTGERRNVHQLTESIIFLSCEKPVQNSSYIPTAPCINETESSYSYVVYGNGFKLSDLEDSCRVYHMAHISPSPSSSTRKGTHNRTNIASNYMDVYKEFVRGFQLSWVQNHCYVDEDSNKVHCLPNGTQLGIFRAVHAVRVQPLRLFLHEAIYFLYDRSGYIYILCLFPRTIFGVAFVIGLIMYKWQRRHLSTYDGIEEFLQSHNNLMPIRYSYYQVKEMTGGFKIKLGQGGFGSVYKGELRSRRFVAVKMLSNSKADGQDFINEVATIGRIHHVHVVRLIGFCVEGSKRALIYDFMPNGSLDNFIFTRNSGLNSLNYKKIFKISVGIARGIEYLHRGCDMQILHFDIKPHNILLDENFVPKISDFGLARLCPLNNSTVSLTAARGTIGYIAPELFYKNIGGVSSKADVYSFGMLLMEMANRRKNLNANADNSSQIYFPSWIYDQVSKGKDIEIEDATEEESETTKKMIMVALWCVQLKPCDRPSMSKVVEMLQGKLESLQMPPKPSFYPQENHHNADDTGEASKITCSSTLSDEDSQDIS